MQVSSPDVFSLGDDLGPAKVLHISLPGVGLRAIVVVDNTAAGPSVGGTRMAPDVTLLECARLARAMTLKNAAAGLPHGGAKSVIFGDPKMPAADKERHIRAFARAIEQLGEYVPGPDMGTDETAMAWIKDEIGRSVGLPRELGGIPLDEIGATGLGLAVAAVAAQPYSGVKLAGARIVIQGFGAVGKHAARFLAKEGALIVGVADSTGAVASEDGLDIEALAAVKAKGRSVAGLKGARQVPAEDLVALPCDIFVPAARPDVLHAGNVGRLQCRLVVQGANIPATAEAEASMHARGILNIPDFIANAGGVICAAIEYAGGSEADALTAIKERIARNTHTVLKRSAEGSLLPRQAAEAIARERVVKAMRLRRWR